VKNVVNRDIISAISQNQSTSENNFWIDMTGYDFTRFAFKQFENEVSPVLSLPDFDPSLTTYIRDSMALVQCMDAKKHKTFGDLATDYCRPLTSCFVQAHTVADVFDRYDVKKLHQVG
jgi:hypothetical protein